MGKRHETTVTFLEMKAPPALAHRQPKGQIALMRAKKPPVHFYRYLYHTIGNSYVWVHRKRLTDDELCEIIHSDEVCIYVLYVDGAPAGMAELDFRSMPEVELTYLGLMPEYVGRGLGGYLLSEAIRIAWSREPSRFHVQTCTMDHPRALPLYQKYGFVPFARRNTILEEIDE